MSVAPEIARLAEAVALVLPPSTAPAPADQAGQPLDQAGQPLDQAGQPLDQAGQPASHAGPAAGHTDDTEQAAQLTVGTLARRLRSIAGAPERWWGLVRFEPDHPVTVTVEASAAYHAWLVVMPPGDTGQSCDCDVATMIAGEATEGTPASAVLCPGPVRVHGGRHGVRGRGAGYSISLHARATRSASEKY
jgi:hypothetical protein